MLRYARLGSNCTVEISSRASFDVHSRSNINYPMTLDFMNFLKLSLNVPSGEGAESMFCSADDAPCDHPRAGSASDK